jgi:hypothetical protein
MGKFLMLGFEVAQSTVSKYVARGRRLPSQSWKTFLQNYAEAIAAIQSLCRLWRILQGEVDLHPKCSLTVDAVNLV